MKSWKIAEIGDTSISIHPSLLCCIIYAALTGHILLMACALVSILVHEAFHALMAAALGHAPNGIEVTPLGAVMRLEDERQMTSGKRILMLLAGPAATFLICLLSLYGSKLRLISNDAGQLIFMCNLSILLLNLLPVLPLDGGRIASLILERLLPLSVANQFLKWIGMMVGLCLIALNVAVTWRFGGWNLSLALAGCSVIYSASVSTRTQALTELQCFLDRRIHLERRRTLPAQFYFVLQTQGIRTLVRKLPSSKMAVFASVEPGSMKIKGWLTENEIIQIYLSEPSFTLAEAVERHRDNSDTN